MFCCNVIWTDHSKCNTTVDRIFVTTCTFFKQVKISVRLVTCNNIYSKCPKILYTQVSDKMAYANSTDPDQTAPEEQSDQGLHCLSFH